MSKEAIKLAIEALQYPLNTSHEGFNVDMAELLAHRAIKALEAALAKQEQDEPVACLHRLVDVTNPVVKSGYMCMDCKALFRAYATPQQRTWVGLTDEQILADETLRYHFGLNGGAGPVSKKGRAVIDAVESAHGIKE